ncbi:MAG TPA: cytochrome c biogenesis protein CcsA [Verrucomicrobiae bacterium]|nr:cytochrome c biogenesis protein CcsA [Verrucomicrobiae bacterium]
MAWLTDRHYFLLAVIFYGLSMVYSVFVWRKGFREDNRLNYFLLLFAFAFHTTAMFQRGFSLARCPVNNLYEATIFIAWTITASYLVLGALPRLRFLGVFASPVLFVIGVFALMPNLDPPHGPKPEFGNALPSLHAALIFLSFGAFGLGSVAALMYLTQEHDLKFHKLRAILGRLPPIQRLERVINSLVVTGFVLLTAGLSLDPILMHQKFGAYFKSDPILFWSAFIWLLYLMLLVLRWRYGQGGRRFAWGAVGSFVFILLTFWGFILLSPLHNS